MAALGVALSLVALISWGAADFLIQRSARLVGIVKTMLLIGLTLIVGLAPFVYHDLLTLTLEEIALLSFSGLVLTAASLFDFSALREGKMAIAEPIIGLETPLTIVFAVAIAGERLSIEQGFLVAFVCIGTLLIATKDFGHFRGAHKRIFEKGVQIAVAAALGLAAANLIVGETSQEISPLLAMWWVGLAHTVVCASFLASKGKLLSVARDVRRHPWTLMGQAIVDDIAWIAYAVAATLIPISITTAISSGYIALAVLLGIFVTREKVNPHQVGGIIIVSVGIIVLSYLYG